MDNEKKIPWKNWEVVKVIGRGSYGDVYEIQKKEGAYVTRAALKVIHVSLDEQRKRELESEKISLDSYLQETQSNIVSEIYIMESLKSASHIVAIEDYEIQKEEDGWTLFIRMELLKSLVQLRNEKDFTKQEILKLGIDLCEGLQACWQKGVIHRDIKPANIFVSEFGEYKLGDFGISKQLEHTMAGSTRAGTESYMAPEVFYGKKYDGTVDIYSLGIVLYQLANKGKLPFVSQDTDTVSYSEVVKAKQRRLGGDVLPEPVSGGKELGRILQKACAFDPQDRYQSPQEMYRELKKLLQSDSAEETEIEEIETSPEVEEAAGEIHFFSDETSSTVRLDEKSLEEKPSGDHKSSRKLILIAGIICVIGISAISAGRFIQKGQRQEIKTENADKTAPTEIPVLEMSPTETPAPTATQVPTATPTPTPEASPTNAPESEEEDWFDNLPAVEDDWFNDLQ